MKLTAAAEGGRDLFPQGLDSAFPKQAATCVLINKINRFHKNGPLKSGWHWTGSRRSDAPNLRWFQGANVGRGKQVRQTPVCRDDRKAYRRLPSLLYRGFPNPQTVQQPEAPDF